MKLAQKGYYDGVGFHRNIRNFMLQGGDPTGTGKGGTSVWGKSFNDEFEGPLSHDKRGVVSMANKGKNTNTSQFFITYRECKHLDRKHTIFAQVVDGLDSTLSAIENSEVRGDDKRPVQEVKMESVSVFVDPFEEFLKGKEEKEKESQIREEVRKMGGAEDERVTWTGKRVRGSGGGDDTGGVAAVGKYMPAAGTKGQGEVLAEWEGQGQEEPVRKKTKMKTGGGFGNFEGW